MSKPYFDKVTDHKRTRDLVVEFFAAGTGGPVTYSGRDLPEAHKDMGVTPAAYIAVVGHVTSSMEQHEYVTSTINEVLGVLWSLKGHVLFPPKS